MARMADPELQLLAAIIDEWVRDAPGIHEVYLFGSRVRGDHRPDSDVDIRLFIDEWQPDVRTVDWWTHQNGTDFAELKSRLPGPLAIHRENADAPDEAIREGRKNPKLRIGKVVCVCTPPSPPPNSSTPCGQVIGAGAAQTRPN